MNSSKLALRRGGEVSPNAGRPGKTPFTGYLLSLEPGGEPPDDRSLEAVRSALRAALAGELKRRGLWDSSPAYLGVYGWRRWDTAGGADQGPLEELLADCYAFIFVARLRSLRAQLAVKPNIEGLVYLNIRHFLHERQKEHDPLGSQVFEVSQSAARQAVAAGELHVVAGDERIRNDTGLAFAPEILAVPETVGQALRERVARWDDDLLPDLVTLRGRRQEEVVARLRARLPELREEGVEAFRFKELVDAMKADVRARWAVLLASEAGAGAADSGLGQPVEQVALPETAIEDREVFRKLVGCVLEGIARLEVSERTREYLATLWQFLRIQAASGMEPLPVATLPAADEEPLSHRQVAELLRIPRDRLPEFYRTLGQLLEGCRAAISGHAAVRAIEGSHAFRRR